MRTKCNPTVWVVFAIIAACAVSCSRRKESEFLFTYAQSQPLGSLRGKSMQFFEEELEKRTSGRIQVDLYCGGVLGTEREQMDFVATGALQGTRGGFFADANPKFKILTMPFLVEDWDQAIRLVNSPFLRKINTDARKNGWHIPATGISQGFRAHTNNKRPILSPADLRGLKMRVPPQQVFVKTAQAFEANPQEIPSVEIYQALQTGVVDGQDNPPANIWDYKIFEVSKYMTITNYATGPDPLMVNLEWYEKLPLELQQTFDEVSRETIAFSDQLNRENETQFIDKLREKLEVNVVTGARLAEFREAVTPVYQYYVDKGEITEKEVEEARAAARGQQRHEVDNEQF